MVESTSENHKRPYPVVLVELRQCNVDREWTYMVISYLYPAWEARKKVNAENKKKVGRGRHLLTYHFEVWRYNCIQKNNCLTRKKLVEIDWNQFYDTRDKTIKDISECKVMRRIAQCVKAKVRCC